MAFFVVLCREADRSLEVTSNLIVLPTLDHDQVPVFHVSIHTSMSNVDLYERGFLTDYIGMTFVESDYNTPAIQLITSCFWARLDITI